MVVAKRKLNILVVEDEDDLREILVSVLNAAGFQVFEAAKAPRAIQLIGNQRFELVITDMQLEQGTGEQVIQFMRKDVKGFNAFTPVIVVSAFLNKDLVARIGKDISGAMVKPFEREVLLGRVRQVLGLPGGTPEEGGAGTPGLGNPLKK